MEHRPISFLEHPDLVLILEENETMLSLLNLNAEEILLKWANSILKQFYSAASLYIPLTNLGSDLRDGHALSILLHSINKNLPLPCTKTTNESTLNMVVENAKALGIKTGMTPQQLSMLDPTMGAVLVSHIFHLRHGSTSTMNSEDADLNVESSLLFTNDIDHVTVDLYRTYDPIDCIDGDEMDTRNEATLKNWIKSQNFPNLHLGNLFDDDMVSLLRLIDHVEAGLVNWKKVFLPPVSNRFHKIENAHYAVALCERMGLKVINIAGLDLIDGQKKMILAIISQLMRRHTFKGLADLAKKEGLTKVTDDHILAWANQRICSYDVNRSGTYPSQYVTNFATHPLVSLIDPRIRDGFFYLVLIDAVRVIANLEIDESVDRLAIHYPDTKTTSSDKQQPDTHVMNENVVDHENTTNHIGQAATSPPYALTDSQRMSNTCLALNLATHIGAQVYMTGEDLLRGGKKIIAAFLAAVWEAELRHLKNLQENEGKCDETESVISGAINDIDHTTENPSPIRHPVTSLNNVARVIETTTLRSIR